MYELLKKISFYFLIFFLIRLILIIFFPAEHEIKYNIVASNILSGCGVSFSTPESKECIPAFGPNGPGYPFFLASIKFFFDNVLFIKIFQIIIYFISVLFIKKNIYEFTGSNKLSNTIFFILSISPLTIAWARFALPETMMISFALFYFGLVIRSLSRQKFLIFEFSLILLLMTFFRVDSIFFIFPTIYLIFKLNKFKEGFKKLVILMVIFSLPWSIWTLRNISKGAYLFPNIKEAYETISKNKFPIGYNKWVFSWANQQYNFAYALNPTHIDPINKSKNFNYENIVINDEIYFNENEKIRTEKLINKLKLISGKPITAELDKQFEKLALMRIEENKLYYYSILPFQRSINLWLNPYYSHGWPVELSSKLDKEKIDYNNKSFIQKISLVKKFPLEIALKGTFFLWSLALIILFVLLFFNKKNKNMNTCYNICLQLVFFKTIFFAYTGFFETRYIVNLIPLIEILIILAFNQALRKSK